MRWNSLRQWSVERWAELVGHSIALNADLKMTSRRLFASEELPRFVAGGLLLVACVFRLYGLLAHSADGALPAWLAGALLPAEAVLAIWLFSGLRAPLARIATLTLFTAFACHSFLAALHGRPLCGCFGGFSVSPWVVLFGDAGVILFLWRWQPAMSPSRWFGSGGDGQQGSWVSLCRRPLLDRGLLAALVPCLLLGLPAGWLASQQYFSAGRVGAGELYIAEAETWIGQERPLLESVDIGQELRADEWIVPLYHHDCSRYQEAVDHYESVAPGSDSLPVRIALIEVPPIGQDAAASDSLCRRGRLDDSREWLVETPLCLWISAGVVREPFETKTELPTGASMYLD